jgi:hypothetical protein
MIHAGSLLDGSSRTEAIAPTREAFKSENSSRFGFRTPASLPGITDHKFSSIGCDDCSIAIYG